MCCVAVVVVLVLAAGVVDDSVHETVAVAAADVDADVAEAAGSNLYGF